MRSPAFGLHRRCTSWVVSWVALVFLLGTLPWSARGADALRAAPPSDGLKSRNTYAEAYGQTKNAVALDPAKELPHYPAVTPKDAPGTWKVKAGFRMELAAHEPQVRDPIAICFDERGRMFVCEMIDYSEMRDVKPHLGRVSMVEDKDGDGLYETATVFADDLPWPTGLIWANGGLYVAATPDIWRFEDRDGDGRAEVREKIYTGFGTGLAKLNVQGMLNSLEWGQDNRVHVLAGGGNRGVISSPRRPDLQGQELGGRDFWFDPLTHDFGFETGGAQYGMSFDDFGRKFGCSNSDHLQYWVYDGDPGRSGLPSPRQSIAVDGGAAEVYRISPDEPWRIVRTRWRISGTVPGMVEGGGRVSGYFTGATGTTIYRGDAYGPEFLNNSFTGDAGGQLVHRKVIRPARDGVNLEGERPADERGLEFAASVDTWVRVVNFANAPDGCLYVCDMYREIIEHPWSIPEEIKQYLDLNQGNDRGRIWRIIPARGAPRKGQAVGLDRMDANGLVATLAHSNGWHRDTAHRLLYERRRPETPALLAGVVRQSGSTVAKLHALGLLAGLARLSPDILRAALDDQDAFVRERALRLLADQPVLADAAGPALASRLDEMVGDAAPRVRFQLALALGALLQNRDSESVAATLVRLARRDFAHPWIGPATLRAPVAVIVDRLFPAFASDKANASRAAGFVARLIDLRAAAARSPAERAALVDFVAEGEPRVDWMRALGDGLRRAGIPIAQADADGKLTAVFARAAVQVADRKLSAAERLTALEILSLASSEQARPALETCLQRGQPDEVQAAAMKILLQHTAPDAARLGLEQWDGLGRATRDVLLDGMLQRPERARALLETIERGRIAATALSATRVQKLAQHADASLATRARLVLAEVIPPSRAEVAARYKDAASTRGVSSRGQAQFEARCAPCHRAGGLGVAVGPDLVTVKTRGREALLAAILEPSKEVAAQYIVYEISTKDGDTFSGFIAEDNATSVTLKMAGGATQTIPRNRVQGTTSAGQSLMPEGLEAGMSIQDMADLLTFIEALP